MPKTLNSWMTIPTGVAVTLLAVSIVFLLPLAYPYNFGVAIATFFYVGISGTVGVPIGFRGVPAVFGERLMDPEQYARQNPDGSPRLRSDGSQDEVTIFRARFELSEGWHWLPPRPFMSATRVDTREQAVEVKSFAVASKAPASVRITIPSAVIRYRIVNPGQSLSVTEGVIDQSLTELVQQELRAQIRRLDDQVALDAAEHMREELQRLADVQATEWGIDVIQALLGELALPPDIQAAYEKLRIEERQSVFETRELQHIEERLLKLIKKPLSLSREAALELIQTERDKVKKNITEFKGNLSPETRQMVRGVAAIIAGRP